MNVSNREKQIYNTYLAVSRTARGEPFKPRKDFEDFDADKLYNVKRIASLLQRYPHIKPEDYFRAPYDLYSDQQFDLSYFANMTGVAAYTQFRKKIDTLPPDHEKQLEFIADSLKFIAKFCCEKKIKLEDYTGYQSGITFDWMKHLKRHEISVYVLMEFQDIYDKILSIPEDEKEILLGDIGKYYLGYKTRYLSSEQAKTLVQEGLKKVKSIIENK